MPNFTHFWQQIGAVDALKVRNSRKEAQVHSRSIRRNKNCREEESGPNTVPGLLLFQKSAYWQILEPNLDKILNPLNPTFAAACAPTANKDKQYTEEEFVLKHNFDKKFDIPIFQGKTTKV